MRWMLVGALVVAAAKMGVTDSVLLFFITLAQACLLALYRGDRRLGVGQRRVRQREDEVLAGHEQLRERLNRAARPVQRELFEGITQREEEQQDPALDPGADSGGP